MIVLGTKAAQALGMDGDPTTPRSVYIGDEAYTVIGVMSAVPEIPQLSTAGVIPVSTATGMYGAPSADSPAEMMVHTQLGAAQLIARQAPYTLRPDAPDRFVVDAPQDWSKATGGVKSSMSGLLLGLAAMALLIGCVGIANATLTSIYERIPEIGLRRALGARPAHIAAQVLGETAVLGGIGGLLGMNLGLAAVLVVCVAQSWTAVIDPMLLALGPTLGVLTGVIAGLYPAWKASRISPVAALQHL